MRQVPMLMYHWFRAGGAAAPDCRSPQLEMTAALFGRQMAWLAAAGYDAVTVSECLAPAAPRLPRRPVAITFDDGTLDFWEHARPILARHGMRATVFVVTGSIGGRSGWDCDVGEPPRRLMDWAQLRALAAEGHELGSHTCTHRPLPALPEADAAAELRDSRAHMAAELGAAPACLAYPRGAYGPREKRLARDAGYAAACAVVLRWRDLWRSDPFALKRMTVKGTESLGLFRARLCAAGWVRMRALRGCRPAGGGRE